jgi:hypothetical protein
MFAVIFVASEPPGVLIAFGKSGELPSSQLTPQDNKSTAAAEPCFAPFGSGALPSLLLP